MKMRSPPLGLTRPRITGSAAVPRICKLAAACRLKVRLTRFTPVVDCAVRLRCKFWVKLPAGGGAASLPVNWPRKLLKSKLGVKERLLYAPAPRAELPAA